MSLPGEASPSRRSDSWFLRLGRRAMQDAQAFWAADPLTLAASIAFYTALSFAPILMLAMMALSRLSPGEERRLVDQVTDLFGTQVGDAARLVVENADASSLSLSLNGAIALGALLVSATTAFAQLQEALNRVWGIALPEGNIVVSWLRRRVFSLGIIAVIGFLLVTALVVSTLLAAVLTQEGWLWFVVNEIVTLAVLAGAFACLYRFVPDEVPPWTGALHGGAITAVLFEGGKWGLGTYLSTTTSDDAYGGAGSFVLLLLWVYYSAFIVLLGAGATRALGRWRGWKLAARRGRG